MSPSLVAALPLGVLLGLGLWTLVSMIPRLSRPRLLVRVAPYVVDSSPEARDLVGRLPSDPAPLVIAIARPVLLAARRGVARVLGGDQVVADRLRQAGIDSSVDAFRSRQLQWCAVRASVGAAVVVLTLRAGTVSPPVGVVLGAAIALAGLLAPEHLLVRAARERQRRLRLELPTILEFLALSLTAGESLFDAIRRVARAGSGGLSSELAGVVAASNAGEPLVAALRGMAEPLGIAPIDRVVQQLVIALDRGTPVAEVLHAQAQDARDDAKRSLIEAAGRKEVAMLIPLVFLILPVTVAFAIFPATIVLNLGF